MTTSSQIATATVIAVPTPPPIVCPSWCAVSQQEHIEDLPGWEGRVIHWSRDLGFADMSFRVGQSAYVDGTVDPDDPTCFHFDSTPGDGVSPEKAEAFAHMLLAAVREARA